MGETICCVCHQPVGPEARRLGGRIYCERHYVKVTQDRRSVWSAALVHIAGQVLFVLVVVGLVALVKPALSGWALVAAGLVLALMPAILWLAFFYRQDRLELEPKGHVISVFLLGALLAQGVGIPLVESVYEAPRWLPLNVWTDLLGSILVIGFVQEALKYAAVRYSVYLYVVASGGVDLTVGVIRIAVTALAQARS